MTDAFLPCSFERKRSTFTRRPDAGLILIASHVTSDKGISVMHSSHWTLFTCTSCIFILKTNNNYPHALDQRPTFHQPTRIPWKHHNETMEESCCTCATLLKDVLPQYDSKSEKPKALDRRLDCCGRVICGNCIAVNTPSLPNPELGILMRT